MKKQKPIISIIFILAIIIFSGCATKDNEKKSKETNISVTKESKKKMLIYTTFFPVHDFATRIIGDKHDIKNIIDWSAAPHGFELNATQVSEVSKSDLIIYNGANMEEFIPSLKSVVKNDNKFLDLSQGLTLLTSADSKNEKANKANANPHTWLSIKNAMKQLDTIYRKMASIDPENEPYYKKNLDNSLKEFDILEKKFSTAMSKLSTNQKYLIVSHAAFNYLAKDYNLKQVAITGVSPEDEPSAKALRDIAEFVKKHNIKTIFFEGKATPKVAKTLANETGSETSTLYTMEALKEDEAKLGYLKLMQLNLDNIIKGLTK